jgi:hypothetical protein
MLMQSDRINPSFCEYRNLCRRQKPLADDLPRFNYEKMADANRCNASIPMCKRRPADILK